LNVRKPLLVLLAVCAVLGPVAAPAAAAPTQVAAGLRSYFVITEPKETAKVAGAVTSNGGSIYAAYDAIGVLVVHSSNAAFVGRMRTVSGVQKVGATRTSDVPAAAANPPIPTAPKEQPATSAEVPRPDMTQIGADKAWAVNPGSPSVTVGVLDTGVDDEHPDLKANFDASKSASCAYGKADTRPGAWRPVDYHGTHVAGTIAAAKNGKGMVGVAPGVKVSSIRIAEAGTELFFPENTVCAFVFAADKKVSVTNNSYYVDPWLYACPSDADQAAIVEAVRRSVAYAESKGVVNVAAAGNESNDLAVKSQDNSSPDDSKPVPRSITNDCLSLPTELPGVIVVGSVGANNNKSAFSNFGAGKINLTAPGEAVYSTMPGGGYANLDGTSMASPHVAGVAALIRSASPSSTPAQVRARLAAEADDLACPVSSVRACAGTAGNNSYYGEGLVDAADAVGAGTRTPTSGVTITMPSDQLGIGGVPAVPLLLKAQSRAGEITYSAVGLPPGLSIDPARGWVTGVLAPGVGKYKVTATARDAAGKTAHAVFYWDVWSF
jgi:subtilisin family serine protease